jgi:hypothetical protein
MKTIHKSGLLLAAMIGGAALAAPAPGGAAGEAAPAGAAGMSPAAPAGATPAPDLSLKKLPPTAVSAALKPSATDQDIRDAGFAGRHRLVAEIRTRMQAGQTTLAHLRSRKKALDAPTRARFTAAVAEAETQAKALKQCLSETDAATVSTWGFSRSELILRYEAYAAAADDVAFVAQIPPTPPTAN